MTINPYQPTIPLDTLEDVSRTSSDRSLFDGVIKRQDYQRLLPNRQFLWWLQAVLLLVLMPVLVGSILIAAIKLAVDGLILETFVIMSVSGTTMVVAGLCIAAMRTGWRSRKYLSRFPDLIGVARGEFNRDGLLTHDGVRQHWIGPTGLSAANVSKVGIRVPLPGSPYRYLAFTERIFESYSPAQAENLLAIWRKNAARSIPTDPNPIANLWASATEPPKGGILFKGYCSVQEPLSLSREMKEKAIGETIITLVTLAVVVFFISDRNFIFWAATISALICGYSCYQTWRQFLYGTMQRSWYQYGWVSDSEVAICHNEWGTIFSHSEITKVEVGSNYLAIVSGTDTRYYILREQVADDIAWLRINELLTKSTADQSGNKDASQAIAPEPYPPR
ncbi:MAG TPA: hypothetical protein DDZ51_13950 [Planctomycetaceae bacterium]|nr:hypothetical protein [Planctomycetaceae bacterium]